MLQYIILICLFFFSLTIVYTALILKTMVLFSTVKSINDYLCMKRFIFHFALKSVHLDFRYSLSKNSGKKISPNVLEYDRNIRNLPPFYIVIEMRVI